ncbi:hypothetical protein ACFE04_014309 [Oxalis oulophora]
MEFTRRHCFRDEEEDDGLVSIAEMEAGFSGNNTNCNNNIKKDFCSSMMRRRNSLRNLDSITSPRVRYYDARFEELSQQPYFLESCFLCHKPLGGNRDIFMYRGDTPFCSEECRQEQIDMDEAKEKNWNLSSSLKALRVKDQTKESKKQDYRYRSSTVAAA